MAADQQTVFQICVKIDANWLSGIGTDKTIKCNPDPINPTKGATLDCHTMTLSKWSIVQEIERLIRINSIQDVELDYQFHKDGCIVEDCTPFNEPKAFYKRGKSTGESQRWQCKTCKKLIYYLTVSNLSHTIKNEVIFFFGLQSYC